MAILASEGANVTVKAFLKRQSALLKAMKDISAMGFLADTLLRKGYPAEGGVVPYTRSETIFLEDDPEVIEELGEYPFADYGPLTLLEERARKHGLMVKLSEEVVRRSVLPELDRALTKLTNTIIRYVDGIFMAKLAADPDINQITAAGLWTPNATTITTDVENAKQAIYDQSGENYEPDTLVIPKNKRVSLTTNTTITGAFTGSKAPDHPIFRGQLQDLWGLNVLYSEWVPTGRALLLERFTLGGIADEIPMEVRALPFNEYTDAHILKGRRVVATFLQEPKCATWINTI